MKNETNEHEQQAIAEPRAEPLSIKPSIAEIERFIQFLNIRFSLGIKNDLVILIQKTEPNTKGYFSPKSWKLNEQSETQQAEPSDLVFKHQNEINEITISSFHLINTPYETIAHELAHYLNTLNGYKGNSRNYHTKDFKQQAEKLLLKVEKGNYGFNITSETKEFKEMLNEFKPDENAFKIFQKLNEQRTRAKSRLIKYSCSCGCIIRTARNETKPLKAYCEYCNTKFEPSDDENDD